MLSCTSKMYFWNDGITLWAHRTAAGDNVVMAEETCLNVGYVFFPEHSIT